MNLLKIFSDIPIMIVLITFISSLIFCVVKYNYVNKNLKFFYNFISQYKKSDLNFRFKEIDEWMMANPYVMNAWIEFKNTLVFSESVALKGQNNNLTYKEVSSTVQNIQTTVDPLYFFDEETLVTSKYNYKFMNSVSTILTGFGPLFTFLNIAIAFGKIDFYEKLTYNFLCRKPMFAVQGVISKLFDNISSEKFLFELLRETKIQNNALQHIIAALPNDFKVALNSGIAGNLVPYLENLIFGMNLMNKQMKEVAKSSKKDSVDELF